MVIIGIGSGIFILVIICILLFNYLLIKYYTDPSESYYLATLITVFSFTVTLVAVFFIPIDIYIATSREIAGVFITQDLVREILMCLFGSMVLLAFIFIPFTYFYGEERFDEMDYDSNVVEKICTAAKYTLGFIIVCTVLIVVGLIFRPGKQDGDSEETREWVRQLFDIDHVGEASLSFIIGWLTMLGVLFWSIYTGYGLAFLPWKLIKGTKSLELTQSEIEEDVSKIRETYRDLQLRASRTNTQPTRREKKELATLKRKEHMLSRKSERLSEIKKDSSLLLSKILGILTPFRVIIGMGALVMSWAIFMGILLVSIDKLQNSECGFACGYIITENSLYNPIDSLLVYLSSMFPFDYAAFIMLIAYFFITSIYGCIRIGIRLMCFTIYNIKRKSTLPQALLIMSVIMMLVFLGLSMEILTMCPQYATFGSQQKDDKPCTLNEVDTCIMSNTSKIFNKISVGIPIVSGLVYWLNWVFVGVFIIGNLLGAFKSPGNSFEENFDEDEEEESLLFSR